MKIDIPALIIIVIEPGEIFDFFKKAIYLATVSLTTVGYGYISCEQYRSIVYHDNSYNGCGRDATLKIIFREVCGITCYMSV